MEQQKINHVNMHLNCMNLFANYGNYINVRNLRQQCSTIENELQNEKRLVSHLQSTLWEQSTELSNLRTDLDEHKIELRMTSERYTKSLSELGNVLNTHQRMMERWERIRVREDLAMDFLLVLLSFFVVNSRMVTRWINRCLSLLRVITPPLPIFRFVFSPFMLFGGGASRGGGVMVKSVRMLLKCVAWLLMVIGARRWAIRHEFHASATIYQYASHVFHGLMFLSGFWRG